MTMVHLGIRIDKSLSDKIEQSAKKMNHPKSDFIRSVLERTCDEIFNEEIHLSEMERDRILIEILKSTKYPE